MCAQELIAALKAMGLPIRVGVHIGEVVNRGGRGGVGDENT